MVLQVQLKHQFFETQKDYFFQKHTVEPLIYIKDPPKKGQPLNNGHISGHQTYGCSVFSSERGQLTFLQRMKSLPPVCPLFRGSTEFIVLLYSVFELRGITDTNRRHILPDIIADLISLYTFLYIQSASNE